MNNIPLFDFSTFPTLLTERLVLRELLPSDAPDVFVFRSDAEVQKYNSAPMVDVTEAAGLIDYLRNAYAEGRGIQWGLTRREENKVLGLFGFNYWDRYHNRADVGYDLARAHWGNGYAREALTAIVRWGFEHLHLHRIEAETIADNHESVRLLESLNFQHEGVRREYSWEEDGTYHGSSIFGLLRQEFMK